MIWEIKRRLYGWGHIPGLFAPLLVWLLTLSSVMQDNWEHY